MALPEYGAREGLNDRLEKWIDRLCKDRTLPFVGLGLIADLKTAVSVLNGEPEKKPELEFDL